jgi:hypothetical protein
MKTAAKVLASVSLLGLVGCAHQQPLISHAHVGHCLTQWHDTPENRGLLEVAEQELARAHAEAHAALTAASGPTQKAEHLNNAARALNPDAGQGSSTGDYGAIRALESAVEHLEYAGTSQDASPNLVTSVAALSEIGVGILQRLRTASEQARAANSNDAISLDRKAVELRALLHFAAVGQDADGDGFVEPTAEEAGLMHFRARLDDTLAREINPKYQPLPRRYLLGLVRLPDGKWAFLPWNKLARPNYGY